MNDIVNRLRTNRECLAPCLMDEAADTIERLTAERDEARRSLCRVESSCRTVTVEEWSRNNADGITKWVPIEPERVAAERGWSCFKEDGK